MFALETIYYLVLLLKNFFRDDFDLMRKFMIPWNVNVLAGDYLSVCIKNKEYLQQTWEITGNLRRSQKAALEKEFPEWDIKGEDFLSWMWIDTKSVEVTFFESLASNLIAYTSFSALRLYRFF